MEIGFDDCKVFVSNVDSQGSAENGIVVQVIGELSNKGGPWRKFAQTFFLAEQPNGYFVLNDIFRYIKEESDEDHESSPAPVPEPSSAPAPPQSSLVESAGNGQAEGEQASTHNQDVNLSDVHGPASTAAAVTVSHAAEPTSEHVTLEETVNGSEQQVVDLHDDLATQSAPVEAPVVETSSPAPEVQVNGSHAADASSTAPSEKAAEVAEEPAAPAPTPAAPKAESTVSATEEPVASTSRSPAPAASAAAAAPAAPKPSGPPVPKTWANLAAAGSNKWKTQVMSATQGVSSVASSGRTSPAAGTSAGEPASSSSTPTATASGSGSGFQGSNNYPTGPGHETGHSIIVSGVTQDMSHNALRRRFSDVFAKPTPGQPNRKEWARIPYIHIDRPSGIAYMDFESEKAMEQAIKRGSVELDGTQLKLEDGRGAPKPAHSSGGGERGQGSGRGRGGDRGRPTRGGKEGGGVGGGRGRGQPKPPAGGARS